MAENRSVDCGEGAVPVTSHAAVLELAVQERAFVRALADSGIGRIVLLSAVERRVRLDAATRAKLDRAAPSDRLAHMRAIAQEERDRRVLQLQRLRRLEQLHWSAYEAGIRRFGRSRCDVVRDNAAARYGSVYARMVVAVALAVLAGELADAELRQALAEARWPADLPFPPVREAQTDVLDEVRSARSRDVSTDEQLALLDDEDGSPDMQVIVALAGAADAPTVLSMREELDGRLQVAVIEYDELKRDIATRTRDKAQRMLDLARTGAASAAIGDLLVAEGYEVITPNAVDAAWRRALAPYEHLPTILCRKRADFEDTVWLLEQLSATEAGASEWLSASEP